MELEFIHISTLFWLILLLFLTIFMFFVGVLVSYLSNKTNAFLNRVKVTEMLKPNPANDEQVIFILEDHKNHEFSVDLKTIFKCLYFAEQQSTIPKLPTDWWKEINAQFKINPREL